MKTFSVSILFSEWKLVPLVFPLVPGTLRFETVGDKFTQEEVLNTRKQVGPSLGIHEEPTS